VNPKILQKYDYFMEHHGIFVTFILFLLPGFPKDAMCYILGLSHMNTRIFLIVATIGRLLGTVMLSLGGSFLRNDQKTAFFITAVAAAVIVIVAFFFRDHLLRRLRKKNPHTK
jgi:uncharacterized membrane protein YdjX (TVP38/TMEM64 family)